MVGVTDKLYSIEELQKAINPPWPHAYSYDEQHMAKQLIDTMRDNQRLREFYNAWKEFIELRPDEVSVSQGLIRFAKASEALSYKESDNGNK